MNGCAVIPWISYCNNGGSNNTYFQPDCGGVIPVVPNNGASINFPSQAQTGWYLVAPMGTVTHQPVANPISFNLFVFIQQIL